MFGVIRRNFHYMDQKTFVPLYKALVRTHLDYASSVYSPNKMKHIDTIESVQWRATKQLPGMKDLTYPERLRLLKLPTLSYRRVRGDMIELYKITHDIYDKRASQFVKPQKDFSDGGLSGVHTPCQCSAGHNLTGIASQFAMHLGFTCDVISVTHRSD